MLKAGETIKYSGGNKAVVMDNLLHKIKEIEINSALFEINKGNHSIVFDCTFGNKTKEPAAKFELRIVGEAEPIKF